MVFAILALLFVIFRFPLFAFLGLQKYGYLLNFVLLLIPFFLKKDKELDFAHFKSFSALWVLASCMFMGYYYFQSPSFSEFRGGLFFLVVSYFPFVFGILKIRRSTFNRFLNSFLSVSFYIGSSLLILEYLFVHKLDFFSQCEYASKLLGSYSPLHCNSGREVVFGFTSYKDISLGILVGAFFVIEDELIIYKKILSFTLLASSLVLVDSITFFGITFVVGFLKYKDSILKNKYFAIGTVLIFSIVFFSSSSYERLLAYIFRELNLSTYFPSISNCKVSDLLIVFSGSRPGCSSNEIHSLSRLFKYGLLPTFGWYTVWGLNALYLIRQMWLKLELDRNYYFNLVFILSGVHYSGAEAWGVNVLFVLIIFYVWDNNFCSKELVIA